jgi:WD40 repeat protein
VTDIAFSPDGRQFATSSEDRTARIWSVETGKTLRVLRGHRDVVTSVAFSPDGARVVTASRDHKPRIWDAGTGRTIRGLIGHFGTVSDASFSPDGRWVLTAGPVTAGLWGSPADRPLLLHGPLEPMTSVSFDATGRRIVASSVEGTVRVYDCRLCGRVDDLVALARTRLAPLEHARAR